MASIPRPLTPAPHRGNRKRRVKDDRRVKKIKRIIK
jgi:hypothetical protein